MTKGISVVILRGIQETTLSQLHVNYMGIGKASLRATELVFRISLNADIENLLKNVLYFWNFSRLNPKTL